MYANFLFLHMMRKYNFYQCLDKYFRELATVFLELKENGYNYPAESLQEILNSEFYVESNQPNTYVDAEKFDYQKVNKFY